MLAELPEPDARGEIAGIYAEIRRLWAVPYVSSLQRHLATRPGWLEWTWATLVPAFTGGHAQTAARRAVDGLVVPRLPAISREALAVWGLDAAAEGAVRAACASFVRVAPINLMFSGLLRRALSGDRLAGPPAPDAAWTPPPPLGALPPLVDGATLPSAPQALLASLGTAVGDERFVPGLYRMIATWPGLLAHVATVLRPLMDDGATLASCRRLLAAVDAEVGPVFALLPPPSDVPPRPAAEDVPAVLAALDTYRKTSPEMVVFGRMLGDALPRP
jgi:hypothetical protein